MAQTIFWCPSLDRIYIPVITPPIKKTTVAAMVATAVTAATTVVARAATAAALPLFNTPANATHIRLASLLTKQCKWTVAVFYVIACLFLVIVLPSLT